MKTFSKYFALFFLVWACEGDERDIVGTSDTEYFPLSVGFYQIYRVDEIRYQQGTDPDTLHYELKTEVVDSFPNTAGTTTYVIYRSVRNTIEDAWQFRETWSARIDNNSEAVVMEGNTAYVRLKLPLSTGLVWDGNKLNNLQKDDYVIKSLNVPLSLDTISFDKTVTVEQEFNDDPIVFTDIREEVYARNVGLVYKTLRQLVICQAQTCNSNEIIEQGIDLKQQIIEYGFRSN